MRAIGASWVAGAIDSVQPAGRLLLLTALASFASGTAADVSSRIAHAHGYRIGDLIDRHIHLSGTDARVDTLPQPGPVDRWLTLNLVTESRRAGAREIVLTYQLVSIGREAQLIFLPAVELRRGEALVARIDAVPISTAPTMAALPFARIGLGDLRPDRAPPIGDRSDLMRRIETSAAVLFVLLAAAFVTQGFIARSRRRAPFAKAAREVTALRRDRHSGPDLRDHAYRRLHRAFDEHWGRRLFAEQVPDFFAANVRYQPCRNLVEQFFSDSETVFFSAGEARAALDAAALESLVRRMARLERAPA